ncbi:DUF3375 domain-containing protein [Pseudobacter ginsenosidimutans]|uniref:Uncharacterized protein DUF3375 n=1 Tax=Pseudobacter ginsenosidimutans TaxID=661488 RepID=A0A4Q7N3K6_9BACT|nr:DUF3375 domain-containing protein [Pseudobacter ginsenosidimutans]QEC43899.1 DUF3375 domain-containing protein [Pseudobacter ginsenosidimutans]RZS75328.1 uncharacterized protein DUF3375 [Pseudobacter ginsenosidimutans]
MQQSDISELLTTSPAVQMIRMRNAHWVLPFLYQTFKSENKLSIPEPVLTSVLAEELRTHAEGTEDLEEARIEFGEDEESRARKYLLNWVQKRLLQDFPDADAVTQYQLSSHTEKVFQWLQSLEKRQFVGTESRFRFLFQTLKEMVEYTEDNSAARLEDLKNKRAEIDKEIKKLEMGYQPEVFSNAQVKERLDWFIRLSYELLSDFREVEDNFKGIHRAIVEQHTKAEASKGAIVGFAFGAYDELRKSDQGKSFYAFWDFLISRSGQEEWKQMTDSLLALLQEREIDANDNYIRNVKSLLLQQGRSVYDANDKMAEKLSRIITEKEIARHRRLRQQISSIKDLVFQLMDEPKVDAGLTTSGSAEIRMSMERKLNLMPKQAPPAVKQPANAAEKVEDLERFNRMLNTAFIDKKKLWSQVEEVLEKHQTATLREIIDTVGLEHGVGEVVSYFSFLKEKSSRVQALPDMKELIPLDKAQTHFIEVPYLLFSR